MELKGNLKEVIQLPHIKPEISGRDARIESGFKFTFDDESEFNVINKIIVKVSSKGTRFEQFPTTFHSVKLSDGSSLKMPSEEKMIKEFTITK